MIVCPHCHHQNSDNSNQCEACCSTLTGDSCCPNCGQKYLAGARFCGCCGAVLDETSLAEVLGASDSGANHLPELSPPEPMVEIIHTRGDRHSHITLSSESLDILPEDVPDTEKLISQPRTLEHPKATLIHQATQFKIQLDQYDSPIHLGKPNRKVMPTINLETFKHAEVISRIHAAILIENDSFFIQDNGSANGTYLNRQRIQPGHPHPLISGDTISLGKGDLVTFTFELS